MVAMATKLSTIEQSSIGTKASLVHDGQNGLILT